MSTVKQEIINYIGQDSPAYFVNIVPEDKDDKFEYFAAGLSNYAYNPTGWGITPPKKGSFNVYVSFDNSTGTHTTADSSVFETSLGIPNGKSIKYVNDDITTFYYSFATTELSTIIDDIVNELFQGNVGDGNITVNVPLGVDVGNSDGKGFDWTKLTPKRWKYSELVSGKESFAFTDTYNSSTNSDSTFASFLKIMLFALGLVFVVVAIYYLAK